MNEKTTPPIHSDPAGEEKSIHKIDGYLWPKIKDLSNDTIRKLPLEGIYQAMIDYAKDWHKFYSQPSRPVPEDFWEEMEKEDAAGNIGIPQRPQPVQGKEIFEWVTELPTKTGYYTIRYWDESGEQFISENQGFKADGENKWMWDYVSNGVHHKPHSWLKKIPQPHEQGKEEPELPSIFHILNKHGVPFEIQIALEDELEDYMKAEGRRIDALKSKPSEEEIVAAFRQWYHGDFAIPTDIAREYVWKATIQWLSSYKQK